MAVDSTHPQYRLNIDKWHKVRNVINSNVRQYIRNIDDADYARSELYKNDAILTNFTARTLTGLVGSVFCRAPEVRIPTELEYLEEDATGDNLPLVQLAQLAISDTLEVGRFGILVDYPEAEGGLTQAEVEAQSLSARIIPYHTENIINWNSERIGSETKMTMIVLQEIIPKLEEDGFTWTDEVQYRVLRLENNTYTVYIYNDEHEITSINMPTKADGSTFDTIPFTFIGSQNNDSRIDRAPLFDLACLNIGHLKNSADYEESIHIVGQPSLFLSTPMSTDEFAAANPNGVKFGARAGHNLGEGGSAQLLQATPNQLADVAMSRKEEQAIMIGARLITPNTGVETAEAARIRYSSENSALSTIVANVTAGLTEALEYAAMFMGANPNEIQYELNNQFYDKNTDPNVIMAQIQLMDKGLIAKKDIRDSLRLSGLIDIDRTDEELDAEAEPIEETVIPALNHIADPENEDNQ